MKNEKLQNAIKESMPELPLGFDTRVDAAVNNAISGKTSKAGIRILSRKSILAMVMVLVLAAAGAVSLATISLNSPITTIPGRYDYETKYEKTEGYYNNTVSVAGLSLRDNYPGLTDKWYNVVPVDLTIEGRQTFTLVASNMYYIGELYVDIKGDQVTTTYATYKGELTRLSDCMNWFTDIKDITTGYLDFPTSSYQYGQAVSIQKDLKSAKVALLFICNRVDYRIPYTSNGAGLVRYWPNLTEWKEFRAGLNNLMDVLKTQELVEYVEETPVPETEEADTTAAPVTEPEVTVPVNEENPVDEISIDEVSTSKDETAGSVESQPDTDTLSSGTSEPDENPGETEI